MLRQLNKLIGSALLALLFAVLPLNLLAVEGSSSPFAREGRIAQYQASEETGNVEVEAIGAPGFDAAFFLSLQKDMLFSMERMAGVLDRYNGSGYPTHCDEFVSYYLLLDNILFELVVLDIPQTWFDIAALTTESVEAVLTNSEAVVNTCANGGRGSLSEHNRGALRVRLDSSMERLRATIRATEERGDVSAESMLAEVVANPPPDVDIDELWRQNGTVPFNSFNLYLDMLLSRLLMDHLGGVYDRLVAGNSAECEDLQMLVDLLSQPIIFDTVPDNWESYYNGHLDSVLTVLDTSEPLAHLCLSGNATAHASQVANARSGLDRAAQQLDGWIEAIEERLGAQNRL